MRDVLIVDDNEADAALTIEAARVEGGAARMHHVGDAVDALAWLSQQGRFRGAALPDLILLDVNMPRINGLTLLRSLKRSVWAAIPVVMFTTSSQASERREALAEGAAGFWTKPPDFPRLIALMAAVHDWAAGRISLSELAARGDVR